MHGGIERSRDVDASRIDDFVLEVAKDLEHVAQLVGAGEAEAAMGVRLDGVVLHNLGAQGGGLARAILSRARMAASHVPGHHPVDPTTAITFFSAPVTLLALCCVVLFCGR